MECQKRKGEKDGRSPPGLGCPLRGVPLVTALTWASVLTGWQTDAPIREGSHGDSVLPPNACAMRDLYEYTAVLERPGCARQSRLILGHHAWLLRRREGGAGSRTANCKHSFAGGQKANIPQDMRAANHRACDHRKLFLSQPCSPTTLYAAHDRNCNSRNKNDQGCLV